MARQPQTFRPQLEALDARRLPSFAAPLAVALSGPVAEAVGDVNGDGKPDLVAASGGGGDLLVKLGKGNGSFSKNWAATPFVGLASAVAIGDVNGDGKADLVAGIDPGDGAAFGDRATVDVLLGRGDGTFSDAQTYNPFVPGTSAPIAFDSLALGDFNHDGLIDIVASDRGAYAGTGLYLIANTGGGTFFSPAANYTPGADPLALSRVAVADVTGDGKLDVVTASWTSAVYVHPGAGNGTFGATAAYAVAGPANSLAVGDFNHDGRTDVAAAGAELDLLLGAPGGGFGAYQKVGPAGSGLVTSDVNADGYLDLVEIDGSGAGIDVLLDKADWSGGTRGHK